ncbi:MAG: GNAT family N-acetyltransferase [Erythrobacter sp.]|nr:GNAT family N-acetyltransferase [Erythrobacter sp.]
MQTNPIRPLARDDLDRVGHIVDSNDMFPSEMLEEMAAAYFGGEDNTHRWIVFDRHRVEGVAYFVPERMTDGCWNLLLIAVDPDAHGRGIGTALMQCVENVLRQEDARILLVETSGVPDFVRTRAFYDGLGYEREARIREYYAAGDDKIVFRKALK